MYFLVHLLFFQLKVKVNFLPFFSIKSPNPDTELTV